ncbi:MAG: glycosyltransferase family 4 protein [Blastocatellia bacterium]
MRVLLAHPGTQYSFRLAIELQRKAALSAFHTGYAFCTDGWADHAWRALPSGWQKRAANRRIDGLPTRQLHCHPIGELRALLQLRSGRDAEAVLHRRNERFQRAIPETAFASAQAVVGFDTSAWILADRCRKRNLPFILDQSIGHPRAKECVYSQLREQFPRWAETLPPKLPALMECETAEHEMANVIVVPSRFVRQTLIAQGVAAEKIRVIPFGTDLTLFAPATRPVPRPMVFLFAGSITARKGVPVLLNAWRRAALKGHAELWLAGPGRLPAEEGLPNGVRLLGPLSKFDLAETMRRAHVFIFPSFFEGLAQVQVEALASGLPLIGSTASGAEDIVVPGETGFVGAPDDAAQFATWMQQLVEDESLWARMRESCVSTREQLGWEHYGNRWSQVLAKLNLLSAKKVIKDLAIY